MLIKDHSFGIVPLRCNQGVWEVFLIQHQKGHWSMPKGHPESNESPIETAKRELFEETHLTVKRLISDIPFVEQYQFLNKNSLIDKTVDYFVAEVTGQEVLQIKELKDGRWLTLEQSLEKVSFSEARGILERTIQLINSNISPKL